MSKPFLNIVIFSLVCFSLLQEKQTKGGCSCSNHRQSEPIYTLSPSMNPFFYVKLNGSPKKLFHFGNKGQGPNDFIRPQSQGVISINPSKTK